MLPCMPQMKTWPVGVLMSALPDLRGDSSTTFTAVLLWDLRLSASCRFHMAEFFCLWEGVSATRVLLTGDLNGGDIRAVNK